MNRGKPWFEHLVDDTGELFGYGTVSGSAFYMLKGMYNSPKGECLSRGLQAVRMNVPRFASNFGIFGGLSSVLESSMIYARQKDDPWNSILASAASFGFLRMRRGIG
ncbi:mitochondrial import inner membrane translocase subunit TIM17-2-like [Olea europaea subsp. europaea]|uniref:Mitochondrial import inner membrane translocase subunit TIM17-2-like n=2 Tax=Olea europaea subsp. europaea TaxID=158383 RepID=A0A8S0USH5_OLEEU|nr:mitochondrial import inner membrane translocase subunit TIM17-2-like [Olea europaea subsp. europaea]